LEYKILLVGLGNIGIRHLEGILAVKKKLVIYIFDRNEIKYLDIANYLKNKKTKHTIIYVKNILDLKTIDLLILATDSLNRLNILEKIIKCTKIKSLLLEKVVFLDSTSFNKAIKLIKLHKIKAWVNCIRREVSFYNKLKKNLKKSKFKIHYTGYKWGLASNLIHFIDLFFYFSISKNISYFTKFNNKKYITKRSNYHDIHGLIKIKDSYKNELILEDNIKYKKNLLKIEINNKKYIIKNNLVYLENLKLNRFNKNNNLDDEKVSVITTRFINKILKKKKINLANLEESFSYHKILFTIVKRYLKKQKIKKINYT
jgi:hypothetical protein